MAKLQLFDSLHDVIFKMSEGNPGALSCIMGLKEQMKETDWVQALLALDMVECYGSHLYMIWNDSCDRDFDKFKQIITAIKKQQITKEIIEERVKNVGRAKSFDDILEANNDNINTTE